MARDIDDIGGQVNARHVGGAGPFLRGTMRFADGPGITWTVNDDAPGDEVEVTATISGAVGPPGPPGPGGGTGPTGPTGPPGPGYSSYVSSNVTRVINNAGPVGFAIGPFGVGFTWRDAHVSVNNNSTATGRPGCSVTSVGGVGTSNITINGIETAGAVPGQLMRFPYTAAG